MDIRALRSLPTYLVWLAAALLLVAMFLLLLGSVQEDALTWDENPHITAGYAYLRFHDAHLNPEHPPLLKMLAAVPLLPLPLHFPLTHPAWQVGVVDGQLKLAHVFLYESGNDPYRIAARARLAPILLTVMLGLVLFLWARGWAGDGTAFLALFLYAFSPTVLAHGRYVTMDVPAALGAALVGFSFSRFLAVPSRLAALVAGLALGTALLCKFSTVLLVPLLAALACLWLVLEPKQRTRYLAGLGIIGASAALLVLLPYLWMTVQYPPERQLQDTYFRVYRAGYFSSWSGEQAQLDFASLVQDRTRDLRACAHGLRPLWQCPVDLAVFLADKPIVRAWVQFLMGLAKQVLHAREGHAIPSYFMGEVSRTGWWSYFPVVYAIKEPLPFHLLTTLALTLALARVWSSAWGVRALLGWLRSHPAETLMLSWLALYWGIAVQANLNIGVRYSLPVFPFTILLVAREVSQWRGSVQDPCRHTRILSVIKQGAVASLLLWQCVSVLHTYPSFLAYFNEAVGGPEGGVNYTVFSDLDWGQDLRRLSAFVETHQIDRIAVDYSGTSSPRYELGQRYLPWSSALGPYKGWLAVSAYALQIAQGRRDATVPYRPEQTYEWLRGITPVAKIRHSIFVYDLRNIRSTEELAVSPAH